MEDQNQGLPPSPPPPSQDRFSSRFALLLAALGMAIGAGNIWRFPRIMSKFEGGGGTFLIPWAVFLFTWSIPLLTIESAIGKRTRRGVIHSLGMMLGRGKTWIGAFVALCTTGIMCYYAVIAGWCGIYVLQSLQGQVGQMDFPDAKAHFEDLAQGWVSALGLVLAFLVAGHFVARGVQRGIEVANRILLPTLFVLLFVLVGIGLTREGAGAGVSWMFQVDAKALLSYQPWLEGLSQSAWSTGAGWGLLLVLSASAKKKGNNFGNAMITGIGNNCASLIAAFATIPAVFALAPLAAPGNTPVQVLGTNGPGNTGLAMVWLPKLFAQIGSSGNLVSAMFFLALTFAALTSLIAMVELATRSVMDLGVPRKKAILLISFFGILFGMPSAWSLEVFSNQDWVWGLGLILSGLLFALAVMKIGVGRFREHWINEEGDGIGRWFEIFPLVLIPLQFLVLISWWFYQSVQGDWAKNPLNPFETFSIGTCLAQWGLAFLVLFLFNKRLARDIPDLDTPPS